MEAGLICLTSDPQIVTSIKQSTMQLITLYLLGNFAGFVPEMFYLKNSSRNYFRKSKYWDLNQAQNFIWPAQQKGPNCKQRLSADSSTMSQLARFWYLWHTESRGRSHG